MKVGLDGQVERLKTRLVSKGYAHQYGSDYYDILSLVAKIAFVHLLLLMVAMRSWPIFQLDIKNAFLHGESYRGGIYEAIAWFCCSGGVWFGMQATSFIIWFEIVSSSFV